MDVLLMDVLLMDVLLMDVLLPGHERHHLPDTPPAADAPPPA
jgi:hypothetical protein